MSPDATLTPSTGQNANSDQQWVKGLGLTSATTLVMGSMIGSGIFIVSADISRLTGCPPLLIAAWLGTGVMTVGGAPRYGELAAMMPKAGGQYVYLREALGPIWGFLYGWTLFTVIQTGTIAAVGVAFGKFLGHFVPALNSSSPSFWLIRFGTGNAGLNTQNLAGIIIIIFLTFINTRGLKMGAFVQNVFTIAKVSALALLVIAGVFLGRSAQAIADNYGNF